MPGVAAFSKITLHLLADAPAAANRADNLHSRLESPPSGSSNRSSDVAASESHYPAPHGMPHQSTWVHPAWGMGLPGAPARELVNSRQLACGTPPLLLNAGPREAPGVPMSSQTAAAGFGAELDEAAAAMTSMMHHGGAHPRQVCSCGPAVLLPSLVMHGSCYLQAAALVSKLSSATCLP